MTQLIQKCLTIGIALSMTSAFAITHPPQLRGIENDHAKHLDSVPVTETLLFTGAFQLPPGESQWNINFTTPVGTSPLRVTYFADPSCPVAPLLNVQVKPVSTDAWELTTVTAGLDYYSGGPISSVLFSIEQNGALTETCTFNLFQENATGTDPGDPTTQPSTLVGALTYSGGFAQNLSVDVKPSTQTVTAVRIDVPAFCSNVDILEVATVTNGISEQATLLKTSNGSNVYEVNGGSGAQITSVQASLNGPSGSSCTLPVYITSAPSR